MAYKRVYRDSPTARGRRQLAPAPQTASTILEHANTAARTQRGDRLPGSQTLADVLQLQRTIGNRAVGRILAQRRTPPSVAGTDASTPATDLVSDDRAGRSRVSTLARHMPGDSTRWHPAGIARTVIQRAGTKLDSEVRSLVEEGSYTKALRATCTTYGLGTGLDFDISSTKDYNKHLPKGQTASGVPNGLTIGGPGRVGEPAKPIIYIHEYWIRRWVLELDQMGNLIDTIVHELRHVRQRLDTSFSKEALDLSEFQAYAEEILTTDELTKTVLEDSKSESQRGIERSLARLEEARKKAREETGAEKTGAKTTGVEAPVTIDPLLTKLFAQQQKEKASARLPTAASINKAYQSARDHWGKMTESERLAEQTTKDLIDAAIVRVLAFLEKYKSTADAAMAFETKVDFFGQDIYLMNRNQEIPLMNVMYDKYRDAVMLYNGLNPDDKAEVKEYRAILEARWDYYMHCSKFGKIREKDRKDRPRGVASDWNWKAQEWAE